VTGLQCLCLDLKSLPAWYHHSTTIKTIVITIVITIMIMTMMIMMIIIITIMIIKITITIIMQKNGFLAHDKLGTCGTESGTTARWQISLSILSVYLI